MYYKLNTLSFCSNFFPGINDCCKKISIKWTPKQSLGDKRSMTSKRLRSTVLKFFLVIKIKTGLLTLCAITAKKCLKTGQKKTKRACLLMYLRCRVNQKIISLTAVYV